MPSRRILNKHNMRGRRQLIRVKNTVVPPSLVNAPRKRRFPDMSASRVRTHNLLPSMGVPIRLITRRDMRFPSNLVHQDPTHIAKVQVIPKRQARRMHNLIVIHSSEGQHQMVPTMQVNQPTSIDPFGRITSRSQVTTHQACHRVQKVSTPRLRRQYFPIHFPPVVFFHRQRGTSSSAYSRGVRNRPPLAKASVNSGHEAVHLSSIEAGLANASY